MPQMSPNELKALHLQLPVTVWQRGKTGNQASAPTKQIFYGG